MQSSLNNALAHVHSVDSALAPTVYRNPGRQHARQPSIGRNPGLHQDRGTISPSGSKSHPISPTFIDRSPPGGHIAAQPTLATLECYLDLR